jgi:hypothetical protein
VLTYKTEGVGRVSLIASGLARLGVRHFGGLDDVPASPHGEAIFRDAEPLSPLDLTPVPSLSVFRADQPVSQFWRGRRATDRLTPDGRSLIDILVVPEFAEIGGRKVGRDILALPLATALELLRRK